MSMYGLLTSRYGVLNVWCIHKMARNRLSNTAHPLLLRSGSREQLSEMAHKLHSLTLRPTSSLPAGRGGCRRGLRGAPAADRAAAGSQCPAPRLHEEDAAPAGAARGAADIWRGLLGNRGINKVPGQSGVRWYQFDPPRNVVRCKVFHFAIATKMCAISSHTKILVNFFIS